MSRDNSQMGFSIAEALIVLALIGAMSLTAANAVSNWRVRAQLNGTAMSLQTEIRYGRVRAAKEKAIHRLTVRNASESPGNEFLLERWDGSAFQAIAQHDGRVHGRVTISAASSGTITIDPRGGCTSGAVVLENGELSKRLDISPTCRVMVE